MTTIMDHLTQSGLCSGCGVCAGICPKHSLAMQWNQYGEYNPININDCKKECGLCISVCPFVEGNHNEDEIGTKLFSDIAGINHHPITGYYLTTGVGSVSSEERRWHSASGGLATWFLQSLLKDKIVDAVLCVTSTGKTDALFAFTVAKTDEEIYAAAGSAYYPVEMSQVLSFVLENPGRYAVIGLPCFLKALRLAQEKNNKLKERLVIMVGLTCGHLVSKHLAECGAYMSGLSEDVAYLRCRYKSPTRPASQHSYHFKGVNGMESSLIWKDSLFGRMWGLQYLSLFSCFCCDDIVAECADITFMDAWLHEYSGNPMGTSLWVSRSKLANDVIHNGIKNSEIDVKPIGIEKIVASQTPRTKKRTTIAYRYSILKKQGKVTPTKRSFSNSERKPTFIQKHICKKQLQIHQCGRRECLRSHGDPAHLVNWFEKNSRDSHIMRGLIFTITATKYVLRKARLIS